MEQLNYLQQLRYELLKEKGGIEQAQKAFDFIIGTEKPVYSTEYGVFLIYEDGHYEKFNGNNSKKGAVAVGAKYGDLNVRLAACDIEDVSMQVNREDDTLYIDRYDQAIEDFSGETTTKQLLELGLEINLPKDAWIPSAGELCLMFMLKRKLNKALTYLKQKIIIDVRYLSCSVYSATNTWSVHFYSGNLYSTGHNETYEPRVRPVSAFY